MIACAPTFCTAAFTNTVSIACGALQYWSRSRGVSQWLVSGASSLRLCLCLRREPRDDGEDWVELGGVGVDVEYAPRMSEGGGERVMIFAPHDSCMCPNTWRRTAGSQDVALGGDEDCLECRDVAEGVGAKRRCARSGQPAFLPRRVRSRIPYGGPCVILQNIESLDQTASGRLRWNRLTVFECLTVSERLCLQKSSYNVSFQCVLSVLHRDSPSATCSSYWNAPAL